MNDQAMVGAGAAVQRNGSPVVHMRCRITASLRATAIFDCFVHLTVPRSSMDSHLNRQVNGDFSRADLAETH